MTEHEDISQRLHEERNNFLKTINTDELGRIVITRNGVMGNLAREFDTGVYLRHQNPAGVPFDVTDHISKILEEKGYKIGDKVSYKIIIEKI